jgi:hypothetical protein
MYPRYRAALPAQVFVHAAAFWGEDRAVRVVSWNLMFRTAARASGEGELLRKLSPDLMLLQEVNLSAAEALCQAAGADWLVCAADLRTRAADDRPVRSRGVAIGGRGPAPRRTWLPADVPLPEGACWPRSPWTGPG